MTPFQQLPCPSDVARPICYAVKQSPNDFVLITAAGGSGVGTINTRPQSYFLGQSLVVFTNYDNVAPVIATANSDAILGRPFVPNNFTVKVRRESYNNYSNNLPIPQAMICSNGAYAGKVFPQPTAYSPRTNFEFTFQDTTQLFLFTATSGGTSVSLKIQMFFVGLDIPILQWPKFCALYPQFARVFVKGLNP